MTFKFQAFNKIHKLYICPMIFRNMMASKSLSYGVEICSVESNVVDHIRNSLGSETMIAKPGQGIKEHKHGKSLYFAKNAHLTLGGQKIELKSSACVLIPENIPHGWQHAGAPGDLIVTSFEPGHKTYETYPL